MGLASVESRTATKLALRNMDAPFSPRDFLFTLLLKVGVAASIAALLARWNTFRRVLFTEQRDVDQKLKLMLFMTPPLVLGVTLRLVGSTYRFADLSLEGAFLMGLLGGRVVGPIGGAIITIPALLAHEWLGMPAASAAGLLGGLMRQAIPNKEDLWNFGPFTFLNIPKAVVRFVRKADISWEMLPLAACVGNILRRLLRKHETFVPLKEELQFIDDYLDIEVARFGKDNLEIIKEIDDETLEAFVPSMLLQPMVENCLKHGLAPKIEGGRIRLHAEQHDGRLRVEIEDNGVGISEERMPHVYVEGIGLSNVRERLRVLYGTDFRLEIESRPGEGTIIRIEVPEPVPAMPESARTL